MFHAANWTDLRFVVVVLVIGIVGNWWIVRMSKGEPKRGDGRPNLNAASSGIELSESSLIGAKDDEFGSGALEVAVDSETIDLGIKQVGEVAQGSVEVRNHGNTVASLDLNPGCGCVAGKLESTRLAPRTARRIPFEIRTIGKKGKMSTFIDVKAADDTRTRVIRVQLRLMVCTESGLAPEPAVVTLRNPESGSTSEGETRLQPVSRRWCRICAPAEVLIASDDQWLTATLVSPRGQEDAWLVRVVARLTESGSKREAWIRVRYQREDVPDLLIPVVIDSSQPKNITSKNDPSVQKTFVVSQ